MSSREVLLLVVCLWINSCCGVEIDISDDSNFYRFKQFWKNTGFCPLGSITNPSISKYLLSDDVRTNLELIAALPNKGLSNVRVHWLLELIAFVEFTEHGIPVYDFQNLDKFVEWFNQTELSLGFEIMGNPSGLFYDFTLDRDFLWQDLVFQTVSRYIRRYGPTLISNWKFETWNEPDLDVYNLLNFTIDDYISYIMNVRRGLDAAERIGRAHNLKLKLSGPAGLFKGLQKHQLCWGALQRCNDSPKCFFDVITFHRKGNGSATEVVTEGRELMKEIFAKFPNLRNVKISNDEADPIAGWSTPRNFQSDVNYAHVLASIVLEHWSAQLNTDEFANLLSISHDNAFLSQYPNEFNQRTLFARFQMNLTEPPHTQFIQKPVYSVLGMLSNLGTFASDIVVNRNWSVSSIATRNNPKNKITYLAILLLSDNSKERNKFELKVKNFRNVTECSYNEYNAQIIEVLEADITDPAKVWEFYGHPSYPNATIRKAMRKVQTPYVYKLKYLHGCENEFAEPITLRTPFVLLTRVCSSTVPPPPTPRNLNIRAVNSAEVLLLWKEDFLEERCIKSYDVHFKKRNETKWSVITDGWHVPFLSFHFQPNDMNVTGEYKVRAIDLFDRKSGFSGVVKFP